MNKAISRLLSLLALVVASCSIIYLLSTPAPQQSDSTPEQFDLSDNTTTPHEQSPKVDPTNVQDLNACSPKGQAQASSCSTTKETPSSKSYIKVVMFILVCLLTYVLYKNIGGEKESINNSTSSINKPNTTGRKVSQENIKLQLEMLVHGYCSALRKDKSIYSMIVCFYGDPLRYKNKPLPTDLHGQYLSFVDFTGCKFTHTNLTDSNLANVILTNTTCDYQKAFQDNSIKNGLKGGDWYKNNLSKDLKIIAEVYPQLNNNTHKAKLLHIASAFSQLPFYGYTEFCIKVAYWSCELVQLKKVLGNPYDQQLICSVQKQLEYITNDYCWTTRYPQDKVNIEGKSPHANFDTYLREFTNGLTKYQCKSKDSQYLNWYKEGITKNIEGLAATYPHIKEKQLQEEARDIAHALSKSYQIQQMVLLKNYLCCQNRLIRLKKSVGVGVKNKVHYRKAWKSG